MKPKDKSKKDDPANRTDYDSEDTENYKDIKLFNTDPKLNQSPNKNMKKLTITPLPAKEPQASSQDAYETTSFVCFLKLAMFPKQTVRELLSQILSQMTQFELLGCKIINAKKEIYNELVPVEVRTLFKKIAYKFYDG